MSVWPKRTEQHFGCVLHKNIQHIWFLGGIKEKKKCIMELIIWAIAIDYENLGNRNGTLKQSKPVII